LKVIARKSGRVKGLSRGASLAFAFSYRGIQLLNLSFKL